MSWILGMGPSLGRGKDRFIHGRMAPPRTIPPQADGTPNHGDSAPPKYGRMAPLTGNRLH